MDTLIDRPRGVNKIQHGVAEMCLGNNAKIEQLSAWMLFDDFFKSSV